MHHVHSFTNPGPAGRRSARPEQLITVEHRFDPYKVMCFMLELDQHRDGIISYLYVD
jgi:hypothetical protein